MASATSTAVIVSDRRDQVINALRGQTLVVPDLTALYSQWHAELHSDYEQVREELEEWLLRWVPDEENRKKQRTVDSAMASGYFYSGSPLEKYRVLAEFISWYFLWDDEIDCGSLQHDRQGTELYRKDTLAFLRSCLEPDIYGEPPVGGRHNSECFENIGKQFQTGHSRDALHRYANDIYRYVNAVCDHQEQREIGLSTVEGYIERRLHTIGSYPCITIIEWAHGLDIPAWIYEHEATKVIFRETVVATLLSNDIVSLRKEVAADEVDSMIPIIMYHRHVSAQAAMEQVLELLERSYNEFVAAENRLLDLDLDNKLRDDVKILIQGCKKITLGNVYWMMRTNRYLPRSCFHGNKLLIDL